MKRFGAVFVLAAALLLVASGTASAKGDPQAVQNWPCFLSPGFPTWHCVSPGVLKHFGGPSVPSLNFECAEPGDPVCETDELAVSIGPPEGTHFAGTENLIRMDLYAGQPCPRGLSAIDVGPFGIYFGCHHYGG